MTERMDNRHYEAIVLGLGAMGSAVVHQLGEAGVKGLGIDRFIPPHNKGSTHGATRATRIATFEGPEYVGMARRSIELARRIEARVFDEWKLRLELFLQTGGLIIGKPGADGYHNVEDPFARTLEVAAQFDVEHRLLDASELREEFPMLAVEDDQRAYHELESGILRPESCVQAQLDLARLDGVDLRFRETVRSFDGDGDSVVVTTDKDTYKAERLIISAGPWIGQALPEYSDLFELQRQTLFWFDLKDRSDYPMYRDMPRVGWAYDKGIYMFPALDGRDGGIKVANEEGVVVGSPEEIDRHVSEDEKADFYEDNIRDCLPGLSDVCLRAVTCIYTMTRDSRFIIDFHPENKNIVVLSPCSGAGFKHSLAIGEIASQLVTRGDSDMDIGEFNLARLLQ